MNNGDERKKKKRKRPESEDRKVDEDRQPKASKSIENGTHLNVPEDQRRPTDGLTGPEIHLCKALLEGKVREYIVLQELSAELGNKAAELVNTAESRIQAFLESYKEGETATSQTRALAESLEQISHALQGFCSAQSLPKYPLTPAYLLVFAWAIFHDGVEWDSANKRKLLEMLDTIQSHGNQPFNDARPKAIQANQSLFVYTMLDTEAYEGLMTASEETLERYKRLNGYEDKPSFQATSSLKEEEDSSDAEVANSLLAGKQSMSSSQYSQSRASSSKDSKRGYESSASYERKGERTSRPSSKRKQKQAEPTPRDGSKKGQTGHRSEATQPVASTSAVTLEHSTTSQSNKRPRPSASASSASSNITKQEKTLSAEQSRPKSTSPRPAKRRLVAPPSPPEEAVDASVADSTTVILETDSENDEPNLATAGKPGHTPASEQATFSRDDSSALASQDKQRPPASRQGAHDRHDTSRSVALDNANVMKPSQSRSLDAHKGAIEASGRPSPTAPTPILPHSPSPSVRPDLSASSEADTAKLAKSMGPASSAIPTTTAVSALNALESGEPSRIASQVSATEPRSADSARAANAVASKASTRLPLSPIQPIRVIEIFDSDEEEELAVAAAAATAERNNASTQAADQSKDNTSQTAKLEEGIQNPSEADEDTGPNVAGIRAQVAAHVSDSEEEIDELEEDATFIEPRPTTTVPPAIAIGGALSSSLSASVAASEVAKAHEPVAYQPAEKAAAPSQLPQRPSSALPLNRSSAPGSRSTEVTTAPSMSSRPTLHPPSAAARLPVASTSHMQSCQTGSPDIRPDSVQTVAKDIKGKGKASTDVMEQQNTSTTLLPSNGAYAAPSRTIAQNTLAASTAAQVKPTGTASTPSTSNGPPKLVPNLPSTSQVAANVARTSAATSRTSSQVPIAKASRTTLQTTLQPEDASSMPANPHAVGSRLSQNAVIPAAEGIPPLLPTRVEPFETIEDRWDTVFEELEQHVWDALDRTDSGDTDDTEQLRRDEEDYHAEQFDMKRALKAYTQSRNRRRRGRRSAMVEKLKTQQIDAARRSSLPSRSTNSSAANALNVEGPVNPPKTMTIPTPIIAQSANGQAISQTSVPAVSVGRPPSTQPARITPVVRPSAHPSSGRDQAPQASLPSQNPVGLNSVARPDPTTQIENRAQEMLQRLTRGTSSAQPLAQQIATRYRSNEPQSSVPTKATDRSDATSNGQHGSVEKHSQSDAQPVQQAHTATTREDNTAHPPAIAATVQVSAQNAEPAPSSQAPRVETRPRFPDFCASIRKPTLATEIRAQRPAQFNLLPYINGGHQAQTSAAVVTTNIIPIPSASTDNSSISIPVSNSKSLDSAAGSSMTHKQPAEAGIDPRQTILIPSSDLSSYVQRSTEDLLRSVPPPSHLGPRPSNSHRTTHATSTLQPPVTGPFAPRMVQQQNMANLGLRSSLGPSANAPPTADAHTPEVSSQQNHRRHVSLDHPIWRRMAQLNNAASVPALDMLGQPINQSVANANDNAVGSQQTDTVAPAVGTASEQAWPGRQSPSGSSVGPSRPDSVPFEIERQTRQQTAQDPGSASTSAIAPQASGSTSLGSQPARAPATEGRTTSLQPGVPSQSEPQAAPFAPSRYQGQHYPESRAPQNHIPYFHQLQMIGQQHQRQAGVSQTPATAIPNHLQNVNTGRAISPPNPEGISRQPNTPVAGHTVRQQSPQHYTTSPPLVQAFGHAQQAGQIQQLSQSQTSQNMRQTSQQRQQFQRQQSPQPQALNQHLHRQPQEASDQRQAPLRQAGSPQLSQSQQGQARPPPPSAIQAYPHQEMQPLSSRQLVPTGPAFPFKQGEFANWISRQHMLEHYAKMHGEQGNWQTVEQTANFFISTGMTPEEVQQFRTRAYYIMAMKGGHGLIPP